MTIEDPATPSATAPQFGEVKIVPAGKRILASTLSPGTLVITLPGEGGGAWLMCASDAPAIAHDLRLILSRNLAANEPDKMPDDHFIPSSTALEIVRILVAAVDTAGAREWQLLGRALVDAVTVAIANPREAGVGARRERSLMMRAVEYMDDHLRSDHDVETIRVALNCSRSALYRALRGVGGVTSLLRQRRLAAAHDVLASPHDPRSIAGIARDVGFSSPTTFSRAYRRQFGQAPGTTRSAAMKA